MTKKNTFNFEQAMGQVQQLVATLEQGELPLEESLTQYEQGMQLVNQCRDYLNEAELRVEKIMAQQADGSVTTEVLDDI